jgi:WD40 repeat protein
MSKQIQSNWKSGKFQDHPLTPPHDRGVFCAAVNDTFITTGSADHGLRVFNANTGKYCRELFNKRYGHKEWVTSCAYLPNGRLISGGMDGMLCLWERNIVKCDTLMGHKTSISKLKVDENSICISASYDCTMNIWDLDDTRKSDKMFGPHKNAIMDFDWKNSLVVSGDKDGVVAFWDINAVDSFKKIKCHQGAVASVHLMSDSIDNH